MKNDKTLEQDVTEFNHQVEQNRLNTELDIHSDQISREITQRAGDMSEFAIANQAHGKLSFINGFNKFFRSAEIRIAKDIKENKLWRHIPVDDGCGNVRAAESFADYCKNGLGHSKGFVYEGIQNYDMFGEALDGLQQMGVERNQLRLLRKAPESIVEEVKAAAEKQDKDSLLEIIDDLAARHAKEKEVLENEKQELHDKLARAESENEADKRLLADKDQKINEQARELRRDFSPDEEKQRLQELDSQQKLKLKEKEFACIAAINEFSQVVDEVFERESLPDHVEESMYGSLRGVFRHALLVARDKGINPDQLLGLPIDASVLDQYS
jgi:hypothetical protein